VYWRGRWWNQSHDRRPDRGRNNIRARHRGGRQRCGGRGRRGRGKEVLGGGKGGEEEKIKEKMSNQEVENVIQIKSLRLKT
jgi:hypothetical protein